MFISNPQMVDIGRGIFCRNTILTGARAASRKVTHLARRLIPGVYTPAALKIGTLTGQGPRAQGDERLKERVLTLNQEARDAIIGEFFLLMLS